MKCQHDLIKALATVSTIALTVAADQLTNRSNPVPDSLFYRHLATLNLKFFAGRGVGTFVIFNS